MRWCRYGIYLAVVAAACGTGTTPAAPTPSSVQGANDINGTWVEVGGGTRTWTITQSSISAGGPARFSQSDNPHFGVVSGNGGVTGAVVFGAFMFAETFESLTIPSRPSPNSCYIETDGRLTINGNRMTGSYTEAAGCAGVRVGQATRTLTMQRQ
jgi:hypothetical protein